MGHRSPRDLSYIIPALEHADEFTLCSILDRPRQVRVVVRVQVQSTDGVLGQGVEAQRDDDQARAES